jgi:hypothetical protein
MSWVVCTRTGDELGIAGAGTGGMLVRAVTEGALVCGGVLAPLHLRAVTGIVVLVAMLRGAASRLASPGGRSRPGGAFLRPS